ncbi:hypothetical protein D3C86_1388910 [compost metagenome]
MGGALLEDVAGTPSVFEGLAQLPPRLVGLARDHQGLREPDEALGPQLGRARYLDEPQSAPEAFDRLGDLARSQPGARERAARGAGSEAIAELVTQRERAGVMGFGLAEVAAVGGEVPQVVLERRLAIGKPQLPVVAEALVVAALRFLPVASIQVNVAQVVEARRLPREVFGLLALGEGRGVGPERFVQASEAVEVDPAQAVREAFEGGVRLAAEGALGLGAEIEAGRVVAQVVVDPGLVQRELGALGGGEGLGEFAARHAEVGERPGEVAARHAQLREQPREHAEGQLAPATAAAQVGLGDAVAQGDALLVDALAFQLLPQGGLEALDVCDLAIDEGADEGSHARFEQAVIVRMAIGRHSKPAMRSKKRDD